MLGLQACATVPLKLLVSFYPCFTDKKTEAQKKIIIFPVTSEKGAVPGTVVHAYNPSTSLTQHDLNQIHGLSCASEAGH